MYIDIDMYERIYIDGKNYSVRFPFKPMERPTPRRHRSAGNRWNKPSAGAIRGFRIPA